MALKLPSLVYDARTRVGGEHHLYYNLEDAYQYGQIGNAGESVANWQAAGSCAGTASPPASGILAVRALTPIGAVDSVFTIQGKIAVLPAYSPAGHSVELDGVVAITEPINAATVTVSGGTAKDSVEVIMLPNPVNDVLLCYDQGFQMEVGEENRAIPRKFETVDHYVRQRPSNTISLAELYCCNLKGLSKLRNRNVVLKGIFYPDGGATPSEVFYYTAVRLSIPRNVPQESNDSVQVDASGTFKKYLSFTAPPT
jgi:hypothetical protein